LTESNGQDIVISYYGRKHNFRGPEVRNMEERGE
jgi:hypothetical protein